MMQGGIWPSRPEFSRSSATTRDALQVTPSQLQKGRELFCTHDPRRELGLLERWSFKQRSVSKSVVLDEEEAAAARLRREVRRAMARSLLGLSAHMLCCCVFLCTSDMLHLYKQEGQSMASGTRSQQRAMPIAMELSS